MTSRLLDVGGQPIARSRFPSNPGITVLWSLETETPAQGLHGAEALGVCLGGPKIFLHHFPSWRLFPLEVLSLFTGRKKDPCESIFATWRVMPHSYRCSASRDARGKL